MNAMKSNCTRIVLLFVLLTIAVVDLLVFQPGIFANRLSTSISGSNQLLAVGF